MRILMSLCAALSVAFPVVVRGQERSEKVIPEQAKPADRPDLSTAVTTWSWGTGGELVFSPEGKARHSRWERDGSWKWLEDGKLEVDSPRGKFLIMFDKGIGTVVHLRSAGKTTIVLKAPN